MKSKLYREGYKKERKKRKNKIVTVSKENFNIINLEPLEKRIDRFNSNKKKH